MPIYGAVLQAECCQEAFRVLENSKCEERWGVDGLHLKHKQCRLYDLSGFDVTKTNQSFRLSDSHVSIRFTEQTKFHELPENRGLIPMELFRFRDLRSFNVNVCLSIFVNRAMQLLDKLVIHGVEPRVIAATNINPKLAGGRPFLNPASVLLCVDPSFFLLFMLVNIDEDNGPCPAVRDDAPFEESPVEDCGPLQRNHVIVELQKIEVKVGVWHLAGLKGFKFPESFVESTRKRLTQRETVVECVFMWRRHNN
ncbi:hypothetical protein HID58_096242 [Brassica napus]|uniref:Uncharacterized protein n=1 Tax=Brassica napus TaxID=3708 RepID=A0ABQ7X0Z4_BRANA|nr:hypothetical protein HID58_096242 [Brassica napus]